MYLCSRIWETLRSDSQNLVLMFSSTIKYAKLAWAYAKGICGFRRKVYDLTFVYVPEDKLWYIDIPWPGDRYNLAMVAGSNHLLSFLDTKKENRVSVLVRPSKKKQLIAICCDSSMLRIAEVSMMAQALLQKPLGK